MLTRPQLEELHAETKDLIFQISDEIHRNIVTPDFSQKTVTRTAGWGTSVLIMLVLLYHWDSVAACIRREGSLFGFILACASAYPALHAEQALAPTSSVRKLSDLAPETLERINIVLNELHRIHILPEIYMGTPIGRVMHMMKHALNVMSDMHARMPLSLPRYSDEQHMRLFTISKHLVPKPAAPKQRNVAGKGSKL